ncbi:MAG: hypothetical protein KGJ86_12450, partial [Chloroflexota bacterium]|nr:hypothetical protein [Chloroflexota bacterium]
LQQGQVIGDYEPLEASHLECWKDADARAGEMHAVAVEYANGELSKFHRGVARALDDLLPSLLEGRDPSQISADYLYALAVPHLVNGRVGEPASLLFGVDNAITRLHSFGVSTGNYIPYVRGLLRLQMPDARPVTQARPVSGGPPEPRLAVYTGHEGPAVWATDSPTFRELGYDVTREIFEDGLPELSPTFDRGLLSDANVLPTAMSLFGPRQLGGPPSSALAAGDNVVIPEEDALTLRSAQTVAGWQENAVEAVDQPGSSHGEVIAEPIPLLPHSVSRTARESAEAERPSIVDSLLYRAQLAAHKHSKSQLARTIEQALAPRSDGANATLDSATVEALLRNYRAALENSLAILHRLRAINIALFGERTLRARANPLGSLLLSEDRYRDMAPFNHDASLANYYSRPTFEEIMAAPPHQIPIASPSPDELPSSLAPERLPQAIRSA